MPWKETYVMDLRAEFVMRSLARKLDFCALCREFGISTKTGYKWKERFLEEGLRGLSDRSRRPRSSPRQLAEDQVCRLVAIKVAHALAASIPAK